MLNIAVVPPFYDAQLVLQWRLFWELSLCGKNGCLNRTGDKPLRSLGKAATSVLPPLTTLSFSSKMNMPLTQVALVARPCAPAAQRDEDSSSSRIRLAKSYGRLAPLSLKQDCFFRVPLPKIKISLPSTPAADNVMIFHPEASSSKVRSDSFQKFAPATQMLEFEKQSSLCVYRFSEI